MRVMRQVLIDVLEALVVARQHHVLLFCAIPKIHAKNGFDLIFRSQTHEIQTRGGVVDVRERKAVPLEVLGALKELLKFQCTELQGVIRVGI